MNSLKLLTSGVIIFIWAGLILGLGTCKVLAADLTTTLNIDSPGGSPLLDTVVFNWSTEKTSGTVTESDLTNWSYKLKGGGSEVYSETVISNGVIQSLDKLERSLSDLKFKFDLDTLTLSEFDNDFDGNQWDNVTGVTYNVYGFFDNLSENKISLDRYINGRFRYVNEQYFEDGIENSSFSQQTVTSSVPESSNLLGLLMIGSLAALFYKRQR